MADASGAEPGGWSQRSKVTDPGQARKEAVEAAARRDQAGQVRENGPPRRPGKGKGAAVRSLSRAEKRILRPAQTGREQPIVRPLLHEELELVAQADPDE